jgi:signal peptidase I
MVIKWIMKIFSYGLVLVFLLTLVSNITSQMNGGVPKVLGKEIMTVLSGSMEPGIKTGAIIAVQSVKPEQQGTFKAGDIITYKSTDDLNNLITHRIVKVHRSGNDVEYITKGDNNDEQDPNPIPSANVVAQYAGFTIPLLGYFLTWVKSTVGIVAMMIIPGFILIISTFFSLYKSIMRIEDSKEPKVLPGDTASSINNTY